MVKAGGADVTRRPEASGCGRGAIGRAEVEGVIVTGGGVVIVGGTNTAIGEAIVTGAETDSEWRGGDGAIGSTDCVPLPPVTPRSAVLLEVLEAVEEEEVFLAVSRQAFLAARSASLEGR